MILSFLGGLLVALYAAVVLRGGYTWSRQPEPDVAQEVPQAFFSVIIPVRNEALNIINLLQDLERQQYPTSHFEVLVVDDHSDDHTAALVKKFEVSSSLRLKYLFLGHFAGKRQKKAAIEIGVQHAQGDWIACTDGDCRLSPGWLRALNNIRHQQNPKFISGPVGYVPTNTLWQRLQALEFTALIGMGAACILEKKPTMCNGANLAYEKEAFLEVNGFAGNEQVPSGDDEFLLHKIHERFPGEVAFAKSREAIVLTPPAASVAQFLQQRIRWASKWKHYQSADSKYLAVLVLGANVAVFAAAILAGTGSLPWVFFAGLLLTKVGADAFLLYKVLHFFGNKRLLSLIWLLQLVYVPYIALCALLGLTGRYHWKGRQLTTT